MKGAFVAYVAFVASPEARMDYVTLAKQAVRGMAAGPVAGSATATKATKATKAVREPSPDYTSLAHSGLVARIRAAWPWLAEHRPDLYRRICDADYNEDLEGLRSAMETASRAYADRHREASVRIYSRVLGAELWVAATEEAAAELHRDGVTLPILTADEAQILGRMAASDARELFAALTMIQAVMPGARLRAAGQEVFDDG